LAAEHLDVMAQVDQRLGEMPCVDPLTTDVGLASVGEERDVEREPTVCGPFTCVSC
jgi:hypothetical protein